MHRAYSGEQQVQMGLRGAADSSEAARGASQDDLGERWDLLGPPACRSTSEADASHAGISCLSMYQSQGTCGILSLTEAKQVPGHIRNHTSRVI